MKWARLLRRPVARAESATVWCVETCLFNSAAARAGPVAPSGAVNDRGFAAIPTLAPVPATSVPCLVHRVEKYFLL